MQSTFAAAPEFDVVAGAPRTEQRGASFTTAFVSLSAMESGSILCLNMEHLIKVLP